MSLHKVIRRLIKSVWLFLSLFTVLGSSSSSNPNLFPQNLTNYYSNVFNPNVNTQFLQNINPPSKDYNFNWQSRPGFGLMGGFAGLGIPVSK